MEIRPATIDDAKAMSDILSEIIAMWKSDRPCDPDHVRTFYIEHPNSLQCSVAVAKDGTILGFQALKRATDNNPFGVAVGWGVIGTYVKLNAGRSGIGSALFAATVQVARQKGVSKIDATIGKENALGLKYYDAMGFRTYRTKPGAICKCYAVGDEN